MDDVEPNCISIQQQQPQQHKLNQLSYISIYTAISRNEVQESVPQTKSSERSGNGSGEAEKQKNSWLSYVSV